MSIDNKTVELNDPPMLPGMPSFPGRPGMPGMPPVELVGALSTNEPPVMETRSSGTVDLPAGYLTHAGQLIRTAQVRELDGHDEERLARLDITENVAVWVTELLSLAVEDIGGEKPTKEVIKSLLIGDRDALMLGIRQVTYGNNIDYKLHCDKCGNDSIATVHIDEDISVKMMEDPLVREYEVPLRKGYAKVTLLDGAAQEAFSKNFEKRTGPELNTIMLSKSVIDINGQPTYGQEEHVRALSTADRATLVEFISEHQPGPELGNEILVPCATCGTEYPILLGIAQFFRF